MPLSKESNNASLNPLIKNILLFYLKQKKFKQDILDVLHTHFEIVDYSGKNRVRRSFFYKTMKDNLRLGFAPKSPELYFLKDVLLQNNVRVVKIEGIKYYKGLKQRTV
jgi:hypothetical protein